MFIRFSMLLAQLDANAKLADVEPGEVLGGMLVLSVLAGSVGVIVLWSMRLQQGKPIFPSAMRKPLAVPVPLLVCGVALASLLAWMAVEQSIHTMNQLPPAEPVSELESELADADVGSEDGSSGVAEPEAVVEQGAAETIAVQAPVPSEDQLVQGMLGNLVVQMTIFLMFGVPVLLAQQLHSRAIADEPPPPGDMIEDPLPDVAETNPYAAPLFDETSTRADLHIPSNPFIDAPAPQSLTEPEAWRFKTELRFAIETCLAAYVPMALIRLGILSLRPKAPSHPFIKMMDEGVSVPTLALIALLAIVVAPVVEELLYRVTILGGFMKQQSLGVGMIVSSVLFAFAHGFPDSLALLPLAFALGYTYTKRRSYRTVMLVHFIFNTFNMAVAGLTML